MADSSLAFPLINQIAKETCLSELVVTNKISLLHQLLTHLSDNVQPVGKVGKVWAFCSHPPVHEGVPTTWFPGSSGYFSKWRFPNRKKTRHFEKHANDLGDEVGICDQF